MMKASIHRSCSRNGMISRCRLFFFKITISASLFFLRSMTGNAIETRLADFIKDNLDQAGTKVPIENFYPINFRRKPLLLFSWIKKQIIVFN